MAEAEGERLLRIEEKLDRLVEVTISVARTEEKLAGVVQRQEDFAQQLISITRDIYGKDGLMSKVTKNMSQLGILLVSASIVVPLVIGYFTQ